MHDREEGVGGGNSDPTRARESASPAPYIRFLCLPIPELAPAQEAVISLHIRGCSVAMLCRSPPLRLSSSAETISCVTSSCTANMSVNSRSNLSAQRCPPVVASMSWAVILTRLPDLRTLLPGRSARRGFCRPPQRARLALEGERRIAGDDEEPRDFRQGGDDVFRIPSAKYSCSGSPLMLANGSTAMDGLLGKE